MCLANFTHILPMRQENFEFSHWVPSFFILWFNVIRTFALGLFGLVCIGRIIYKMSRNTLKSTRWFTKERCLWGGTGSVQTGITGLMVSGWDLTLCHSNLNKKKNLLRFLFIYFTQLLCFHVCCVSQHSCDFQAFPLNGVKRTSCNPQFF